MTLQHRAYRTLIDIQELYKATLDKRGVSFLHKAKVVRRPLYLSLEYICESVFSKIAETHPSSCDSESIVLEGTYINKKSRFWIDYQTYRRYFLAAYHGSNGYSEKTRIIIEHVASYKLGPDILAEKELKREFGSGMLQSSKERIENIFKRNELLKKQLDDLQRQYDNNLRIIQRIISEC